MFQSTTTSVLLQHLNATGTNDAWSEFVGRYQPILVGVAVRLGVPPADAADVAQQTLLEFVRDLRAGGFDRSRGRLRSWMLAIANNRVLDYQRAVARRQGVVPLAEIQDSLSVEQLEEAWATEERRALIEEAMRRLRHETQLDERTIRAFELTALRGMPADSVAQECEMTTPQVYVARTRAATKLREIVRELEGIYESEDAA